MTRLLIPLALPLLLAACSGGTLEGVQTFEYKGGDHRTGSLVYAETPPAGGAHNAMWQNCGVYDQPLYNEYAVHSMEHGAVWVTYRPDLPESEVAALGELLDGRPYTLLSPHAGVSSPIVMSAWNAQLAVDSAADERLKPFLDKYEQGATAPERGAACSGGYGGTQ